MKERRGCESRESGSEGGEGDVEGTNVLGVTFRALKTDSRRDSRREKWFETRGVSVASQSRGRLLDSSPFT